MTETSARLGLPHIMPGQAQKEVFHNEALALLDGAVHPAAEAIGLDTPPATPSIGQCWIVGGAPTGEWSGEAGSLAIWTAGGWRFVAAIEGMRVWLPAAGVFALRRSGAWEQGVERCGSVVIGGVQVVGPRLPAIANIPGANETKDVVNAMLAMLRTHGLIAP